MKISDNGLAFIRKWESFAPKAYKDGKNKLGVQLYSIGYGHQIKYGESYLMEKSLSITEAENLLRNDIKVYEKIVNDGITNNLAQHKFDALVSLAYVNGVRKTELHTLVNQNAPSKQIFDWWVSHYITSAGVRLKGMIRRRWMEADIFINGYSDEVLKGPDSRLYQVKHINDIPLFDGTKQAAVTPTQLSTQTINPYIAQAAAKQKRTKWILIGSAAVAIIGIGSYLLYDYLNNDSHEYAV